MQGGCRNFFCRWFVFVELITDSTTRVVNESVDVIFYNVLFSLPL